MKQIARIITLTLLLGIGTGAQTAFAEPSKDPRVADLVQAVSLRVGLGLGTPTLAIKNTTTGEVRGPAVDLGRALAERVGVKFVAIEYARPGAILEGTRTNDWDVAFLVMDPKRAEEADFTQPYMRTDFTYLVPADSSIRSVADADQPGIRIAVPRGDGSDFQLTRLLKRSELVRTDTHAAALELVRVGSAHARAAPRPVLLAEAAKLPGLRVLDDGVAPISFAALVPKGQAGRLAYVNEFIEDAKASGLVKRIIETSGLRGVQVAPAGTQ
jgi:polar amino acid transport system substrate-binding protein